ncbi:hypothetical protein Ocin01_03490 [Orchesella cincta]|uniref:Uncharacterized protein n=1 Tax=Orchesella cincta TaxID=48709 RepID=A0A1D2ND34_ORCCI|nr:hypothetical protein Ocin01_03490 [Orchesella cincta]
MPLFIHNENEVYNEDDGPLPANTPSTGSIGSRGARVVAQGNRVLEILERHKNEVQSRMADREMHFRRMLEKSKQVNQPKLKPSSVRQHNSAGLKQPSEVIPSHPNEAGSYKDEPEIHPDRIESRKSIRGSTATTLRRSSQRANLPISESDEYLDIPEVVPWINRNGASSTTPTQNKSNSSNKERQSNLNLRSSSRGSSRNTNSSSKGSVKFAEEEFPGAEEDPCCNSFPSTSLTNEGPEDYLARDSENNVPDPHRMSTSRHSGFREEWQSPISDLAEYAMSNTHLTASRQEIPINSGVSDMDTSRSTLHGNRGPPIRSQESIRGLSHPGHPNYSHSFTAASVQNSLSTISTSTLTRRVGSISSSQDSSVETLQSARTVISTTTANRTQSNRRNVSDFVREYMWRICVVVVVVLLLFGLLLLSLDAWKSSASSFSRSQNVKPKERYYGIIM